MQIFWSKASENVFFRFYKKSCVWLRKYLFFLFNDHWEKQHDVENKYPRYWYRSYRHMSTPYKCVLEYSIYMDTVLWHTILLDVRCSESQLSFTSNIVHLFSAAVPFLFIREEIVRGSWGIRLGHAFAGTAMTECISTTLDSLCLFAKFLRWQESISATASSRYQPPVFSTYVQILVSCVRLVSLWNLCSIKHVCKC